MTTLVSKKLPVKGVKLIELPTITDPRGNLIVAEFAHLLPFKIKRFFLIHHVPSQKVRGEHAHKKCHQFVLCLSGSCLFTIDDGIHQHQIELDRPSLGLYIPPLTWAVHSRHTKNTQLAVFASHPYNPSDYIRNYQTFLTISIK